jgi:hypothetical protein
MIGYAVTGLWTPIVNHFYVWSLPGVVVATLLGRVLNRRIAAGRFLIYIHAGLIGIAAILLLQGIRK